jgi:hypothetical protein
MSALLRGRLIRASAAAVVGAVAGLVIFELTRIGGRGLYITAGAVAGMAGLLVIQIYHRSARLIEVKVSVPQLSELTFVVDDESRSVAGHLFVETVTRVSTQPLKDDEGLTREALTSLYGLFATTRDILKSSRPSVPAPGGLTVEHLAITMLNQELRPFLSKWHPRLRTFEQAQPDATEVAWPEHAACRAELREMQARIHGYAMGFARLAGIRHPEQPEIYQYDAFLSYTWEPDAPLVAAVRDSLHRLARPWYRLRALRVFLDESSLPANSALDPAIEEALAASRYLIVFLSPQAAASRWVTQEIRYWLTHKSVDSLRLVLTDGTLVWDDSAGDFDLKRSPALPPILLGAYRHRPLYTDLSWAREEDQQDLRNDRFRRIIVKLAAPLHDRLPDELEGEDVRQHRRTRRMAAATVTVLAVLAASTAVAAGSRSWT